MTPFSFFTAIELGKACDAAYLQASNHDGFLEALKNHDVELLDEYRANLFDTDDLVGFLCKYKNQITLAFRGTDDAVDVIEDLKFELVEFDVIENGGKVHLGFFNEYLRIRERLLATIGINDHCDLFITGHSLGSALSTLAIADVCGTLNLKPTCYTFASPRVGNAAFVKCFDLVEECWRVQNFWDIIPREPPPEIGFQHVPQEFKISFSGLPYEAHSLNNYVKCLQSMPPVS